MWGRVQRLQIPTTVGDHELVDAWSEVPVNVLKITARMKLDSPLIGSWEVVALARLEFEQALISQKTYRLEVSLRVAEHQHFLFLSRTFSLARRL